MADPRHDEPCRARSGLSADRTRERGPRPVHRQVVALQRGRRHGPGPAFDAACRDDHHDVAGGLDHCRGAVARGEPAGTAVDLQFHRGSPHPDRDRAVRRHHPLHAAGAPDHRR